VGQGWAGVKIDLGLLVVLVAYNSDQGARLLGASAAGLVVHSAGWLKRVVR